MRAPLCSVLPCLIMSTHTHTHTHTITQSHTHFHKHTHTADIHHTHVLCIRISTANVVLTATWMTIATTLWRALQAPRPQGPSSTLPTMLTVTASLAMISMTAPLPLLLAAPPRPSCAILTRVHSRTTGFARWHALARPQRGEMPGALKSRERGRSGERNGG